MSRYDQWHPGCVCGSDAVDNYLFEFGQWRLGLDLQLCMAGGYGCRIHGRSFYDFGRDGYGAIVFGSDYEQFGD